MKPKITFVRGLPGSGKTMWAERIRSTETRKTVMVAADDFMLNENGQYAFNPDMLRHCHDLCTEDAHKALDAGLHVIVHNTFTKKWEFNSYLMSIDEFDAEVAIVDIFDAGLTDESLADRNSHGVPIETIERMRYEYQEVTLIELLRKLTRRNYDESS
jgi:predicted kinase